MTQAMRQFAATDEMQAFVASARAQRRKVVVEVFHSADGHPLLIHTAFLPNRTA
jgi:CTP:molybdopterin cytidylyltransferase MocA